ncbi:UPF0158 family protein [Polaribacter atrinae]|uniref:Uncharacterized protein n=1 Tax=Polaribacter atrinae TaxID=1333662 RepID=A0A176T313_9FLAO|nr:UPF0158 family protein [Polaribacter atrinae]OAD42101.1 hypothetical protein LPB303_15230 [Polaribacter atrinae]
MDKSKKSIVREIAQELDCGNECYYNFKTSEILAIPNLSQIFDEEEFKESFKESLKKLKKYKADFIKIEILESFESFKIMERFVEQVTDAKLQVELENILANKKPFQNFKQKIDHSNFRQSWFEFKQIELERIVENQLK